MMIYYTEKQCSSSRQDQTQLDIVSESKTNEPVISDADQCLFHMQFKGHASGL